MATFNISPVTSDQDLQDIRRLFQAYAESLGIDLTFQDFATELESLPGKYSPPTGALLLARSNETGEAVGCVALRLLLQDDRKQGATSEMKRLYVSPAGRGSGLGKALAIRIVQKAKDLGFGAIRLDTLPSMETARALYKSLGFREIDAYYETPLQGTIFLELRLKV